MGIKASKKAKTLKINNSLPKEEPRAQLNQSQISPQKPSQIVSEKSFASTTKKVSSKSVTPKNPSSRNGVIKLDKGITELYTFTGNTLGKGGNAIILEAIEKATNRVFAIKAIKKSFKANSKSSSLQNEFAIAQSLDHPNIIKTYKTFESERHYYSVMESFEGNDLFEFLMFFVKRGANIPIVTVLDILYQLLSAVSYMHEDMNLIHRDIKPGNILIRVNEDGRPELKLIDFGFTVNKFGDHHLRRLIGTTLYNAPELLKASNHNEKIDIWAIGLILFNMITLKHPYSEKNCIEEIRNSEHPINFKPFNHYPDLEIICRAMLIRNYKARPDGKTILKEVEKMLKIALKCKDEELKNNYVKL